MKNKFTLADILVIVSSVSLTLGFLFGGVIFGKSLTKGTPYAHSLVVTIGYGAHYTPCVLIWCIVSLIFLIVSFLYVALIEKKGK